MDEDAEMSGFYEPLAAQLLALTAVLALGLLAGLAVAIGLSTNWVDALFASFTG